MTLRRSAWVVLVVGAAAALLVQGRVVGRATPRFTVHEWGTFTAVAAPDGRPLPWRPLSAPPDLPRFVYSMHAETDRFARTKSDTVALARLETPVLYFYADEPLVASAVARFPAGLLTEWYPQAGASGDELRWPRVEVRPGEPGAYPTESGPSRYYHARDAEAAPLTVRTARSVEQEGFLFYRGVGQIELPLRVASGSGRLRVDTLAGAPGEAIVFENVDGRVAWSRERLDGSRRWIERPPARDVAELKDELQGMLTARGLTAKEGDAMVATWEESWFEEGTRLFYLMARTQVDAVLPLRVEPSPQETVRVMVGRLELITPERVDAVRARVSDLDPQALTTDREGTRRSLGRFAQPLLRELLAREPQGAVAERARRLLGS